MLSNDQARKVSEEIQNEFQLGDIDYVATLTLQLTVFKKGHSIGTGLTLHRLEDGKLVSKPDQIVPADEEFMQEMIESVRERWSLPSGTEVGE